MSKGTPYAFEQLLLLLAPEVLMLYEFRTLEVLAERSQQFRAVSAARRGLARPPPVGVHPSPQQRLQV